MICTTSRSGYASLPKMDSVVSRLRRKVEKDPQNPTLILTAWGVGYKFAENA